LFGVIDPAVAHREIPGFGHGKAGHEKMATIDEIFGKKPTYIKLGYLGGDFWRRGYFLMTEIPAWVGGDGIWMKDDLLEPATPIEGSAIRFEDGTTSAFTPVGDAFAVFPAHGSYRGQGDIQGTLSGFVNTYHPEIGDRATGRLVSPTFELVGDFMVLR